MSRWIGFAPLGILVVLVLGAVALVGVTPEPTPRIDGQWILVRIQAGSIDQTLHGPSDFRPELWIDPKGAAVDPGCGSYLFDVTGDPARQRFAWREQERLYGPCESRDPTLARWDSVMARVRHTSRQGLLLEMTGPGVHLLWKPAPPPPPPDPNAKPIDGPWALVSLEIDGRTVRTHRLRPPILSLVSLGSGIDTGCTTRGVDWQGGGYHQIRIVPAPAEGRACPPALRPQQREFLHGLHAARHFAVTTRTLELTGRSTRLTFRRILRPHLDRLDDSRWRLVSLIDGGITAPAHRYRPAPPEPAVWFSVTDGVLRVSRGCRATASGYGFDPEGRVLALDERRPCDLSTPIDRYLTRVYAHPWWLHATADTLTVQGRSGRGLVYRRVS